MPKKFPKYNAGSGIKFQKQYKSGSELVQHFKRVEYESIPDERDGIPIADKELIAANPKDGGEGLYKATYLKPNPRYKERGTGEIYIEEDVYYLIDADGNIQAESTNLGQLFGAPTLTEDEVKNELQRRGWIF